jgi:hypothetical protein
VSAIAHGGSALGGERALPFSLKLIVCFFLADAFEKALALGAALGGGASFGERGLPPTVVLVFDLLLALQIVQRTQAGRIWGVIYLAASTLLATFVLVVEPGRWVDLGPEGRLRALLSGAVQVGFLALLLGRRAARTLTR